MGLVALRVSGAETHEAEETANRWLELEKVMVSGRYLRADDGGTTSTRSFQRQLVAEGAFKFDEAGKYTIHAALADGGDFAGEWANTGVGDGHGGYRFYLKQVYAAAKPVEGVTLQYGGLPFHLGISSPIASYAESGYLTGGRLLIQRPSQLYFDTISYTKAYFGDLDSPGMYNRFRRLAQSNFQQYQVVKKFGDHVAGSLDYTNQLGSKTVRAAAHVDVHESGLIDGVQLDAYQRTNGIHGSGFHVGLEKKMVDAITLLGGYLSIDRNYGDLNDDAFFQGNRVYVGARVQVTKSISVTTLFNQAVANNYEVSNNSHFHLAFHYNLLPLIAKSGFFGEKQ